MNTAQPTPQSNRTTEPQALMEAGPEETPAGTIELMVHSVLPTVIPGQKKPGIKEPEPVSAYEVTFKAVLPEGHLPLLLMLARDHKLQVTLQDPSTQGVPK